MRLVNAFDIHIWSGLIRMIIILSLEIEILWLEHVIKDFPSQMKTTQATQSLFERIGFLDIYLYIIHLELIFSIFTI